MGKLKLTVEEEVELKRLRREGWKLIPLAEKFGISYATCQRYATPGAREKTTTVQRPLYLMVQKIKLERGCIDCGFNKHPAALHFDHRDGDKKIAEIGRLVQRANTKENIKILLREIGKCDVRCANCHAIITFTRRGGRKKGTSGDRRKLCNVLTEA